MQIKAGGSELQRILPVRQEDDHAGQGRDDAEGHFGRPG